MYGRILHCLWYFYGAFIVRPQRTVPALQGFQRCFPGAPTEYRMGTTGNAVIHHNPH
jgi:hypothetical protein